MFVFPNEKQLMSLLLKQSVTRVSMQAVALLTLLAAVPTLGMAQTIGVTAVPSIQRIEWSDKLAFQNDDMYGGRLALQFGKWIELQPFYFTRDNYGVDSSRAGELFGPLSAGKKIDMRYYGSNVQFNLSDGPIVPFARVGAGILRLKPDSADRQDRITVTAGGGLRFGIGGLNAELFAEQLTFRMNPRSLFGPDTAGAETPTLRNLVYGAAVTIPLSTMRETADSDGGLRGSTAPIEPFVGVLRYAGENNLPDQELAGVRAGFDFSPVFGIRGFYWRGVNDDRDAVVPVTGYGGETQFNLNTGPGISPFLVLGAGRIDYGSDFADSLGEGRVDKTALIVGGGASLRLTDRLRLNGAIRDYIMTVDDDLDAVASTGDITHNTMITAGLTIAFGGSRGMTEADRVRERDREMAELRREFQERDSDRRPMNARDSSMRRADEMRRADDMRLTQRERMLEERLRRLEMQTERRVVGDSIMRMDRDTIMMRDMRMGGGDDRWITIPVPARGEIILRYGFPPAGSNMETSVMRGGDSVRVIEQRSGDLTEQLAAIERRLAARIDAARNNPAQRETPPATPPTVYVAPGADRQAVEREIERNQTPVFQRFGQTRTSDLRPYLGVGFGDDDTQLVVGLRANLGPISVNSGFEFIPELAIGLGGSTSVLAMANIRYAMDGLAGDTRIRPYVTLGGGIFSPSVLAINTAVGSAFSIGQGTKPLLLTVELQGLNLFNSSRLLFGLSRSF